jgi:hypothetical protein
MGRINRVMAVRVMHARHPEPRLGPAATDPTLLLAEHMNEIATSEVAGWSTTFKGEPSKA